MAQVQIARTLSDAATIADALQQAWGGPLPAKVLALLLALSDLETATWKSMFNHNFGNIVAVGDQSFFVADDSGNTRRFRAYASLDDGAAGFVKQLTRDSRAEWRAGLLTGDPVEFVKALSGANGGPVYFEANPQTYLQTFLGRWQRYRLPTADPPARDSLPLLGVAIAGAVIVPWLVWARRR